MLEIKDLVGGYGNVQILNGASLRVDRGQIVALLGGNGTGKSTLLKATSGLIRPWGGSLSFDGGRIDGLRPDMIVRRGLVQVTQGKEAFPGMTVEENLKLGAYTVGDRAKIAAALERVYTYFPVLKQKRHQLSGTLSGGQLQMVANARALLGPSRLILMDEPTEGLAPIIIEQIGKSILEIKQSGKTVLLAEQHLQMALNVGDRHYIIDNGHLVFQGTSAEIQANEEIKATYLGVSKERITAKREKKA